MRSFGPIVFTVSLFGLILSAEAVGREAVRVYDKGVPSVDELRAVLIPQVPDGTPARTIVIPNKDNVGATGPATPASTPSSAEPSAPPPAAVGFRINFDLNSAIIPETSTSQLNQMVELLRQEPKLTLRIEGHTDASGSAVYNLALSRRRAESVKAYMVGHGIPAERLLTVGKGQNEPLTDNPYDASNRRVQFSNANGHARS